MFSFISVVIVIYIRVKNLPFRTYLIYPDSGKSLFDSIQYDILRVKDCKNFKIEIARNMYLNF